MTLTAQDVVADFVRQHDLDGIGVESRLLDLVSEVGELAKDALAGTVYGAQQFTPGEAWFDEIGDVCFSLLCLADITGVDLDDALVSALDKYRSRLGTTGSASS